MVTPTDPGSTPTNPSHSSEEATPVGGPSSPIVHVKELPVSRLFVSEIPDSQRDEVHSEAVKWARTASANYRANRMSVVLEDSEEICNALVLKANNLEYGVVVCRDGEGAIQAIALYKKDTGEMTHLGTHPNNIDHPVNRNILCKVRGAGSAIVLSFIVRALEEGKDMVVNAFPSAIPFYQRFNFIPNPDDEGATTVGMMLTVDKIRSLIADKVLPIHRD